ncbi:unnamed protein product [Laminaria digitata]
MRADYDAKIAELMADLEGTRGEKEKTDTDLAILKATTRKERLQWNKERTLLSRKVAEAEGRAREAADGVASPQEERDAKKAAEQEAEARSAGARGLERRLKAAVETAAIAERSAAACIEVSVDPPDVL